MKIAFYLRAPLTNGRSSQHLLDTIAEFLDPNQIPDFGTRTLPKQPAAFARLDNHDRDECFETAVIQRQQKVVANQ
jgi:hypothetical protein